MKRLLSLTALVLCISILAAPLANAATPAFNDISGHWAEDTIERFADSGIISGFPDGSFRPNQRISRAELAAIVTRAFGLSERVPFSYSDVTPGSWYYEYLAVAARFIPAWQSLPDEVNKPVFRGNRGISRIYVAEAFALVKMYVEDLEVEIPPLEERVHQVRDTFRDRDFHVFDITFACEHYTLRYIWLAHHFGIMVGCSSGYFRPRWNLSRAEVLTIIDRMLE